MVAALTIAVLVLLAAVAGYEGSNMLLRRRGMKTMREQPPGNRRVFWLFIGPGLLIGPFEGWAFSDRHEGLGFAVLIVFFVLPEFVLLPLRIRRSGRAAKLARARRTGSGQDANSPQR